MGGARRPHAAGRGELVPRAGGWISRGTKKAQAVATKGTKKARSLRGQAVATNTAYARREGMGRHDRDSGVRELVYDARRKK